MYKFASSLRRFLLVWALLGLVACGGGSGGGGSVTTTPQNNSTLSYASGTQTFVIGTAITAITPTISGTLTTFAVNPALPAGLSLDTGKGTISGTPTAVTAATTYTVSASGSDGTTVSATVSIAVNDVPPSKVSYGATSLTYSAGVAGSSLTPTTAGGAVTSWSISPALPQGLSFSSTDGSISGTPTTPTAAAQYVITAQNSGGPGTVTLTITVDIAPLLNLGHQAGVAQVRTTATTVLSLDSSGTWILWGYAGASIIATSNSNCILADSQDKSPCPFVGSSTQGNTSPFVDIAGTTAVVVTPTGLEIHSTSDGHVSGSITASGNWWRLATDGSYIATGSSTGLSVWSASGTQQFSLAGDYSKAVAFATPGQVMVAGGAAGASVIQTIAVPSGTASTGASFNGTFSSWFSNGSGFITLVGSSALIYSNASAQQGVITSLSGNTPPVGQGNWVWIPGSGGLSFYPATGTSASPTTTIALTGLWTPYVSGETIGILYEGSDAASSDVVNVIDLSGSTPTKTDYTSSIYMSAVYAGSSAAQAVGPYAAVSASQWMVGTGGGVLMDGTTLGSSVRLFGYGEAWSIAAGTGHFAVATASGNILYFNSATLAQEGQIAYFASKLVMSADGTVLVAEGAGTQFYNENTLAVYSLPGGGSPLYTWTYPSTTSIQLPYADIELSASGTVLGQMAGTTGSGVTVEASAPTGGSQIYSSTFTPQLNNSLQVPPVRISPDGTLIAYSQGVSPAGISGDMPGTDLVVNGSLVTALTGLSVGWLDNTRLVVDNYSQGTTGLLYSGCTLYGPSGTATGAGCALPYEVDEFQPLTTDGIYVPATNQILSVSTGSVSWTSGDPEGGPYPSGSVVRAVAGSHVIFVSGTSVLAQSY